MNEFDTRLKSIPGEWKSSVIDVCDTAEMALLWFKSKGVAFNASDIVAMTTLIMEREKQADEFNPEPRARGLGDLA